ncbi:MAG: hypothetical protein LH614_02860 [Pyrinomonadaceae bacterium]|nr:hypothetical protein [Pyrinomonadaceae bacterium]
MKKSLMILLLLFTFICCNNNPDKKKAQSLYDEINNLLDQKEQITKEISKQPIIFSEENLKNFPSSHSELELIANDQIRRFNEINKLDAIQVDKLKQVETLPLQRNFLEETKLLRKLQEKRIENTQFGIEKFQLLLDKNISTRSALEEKIAQIKQKQSKIDLEIDQLENQRQTLKSNR